MRPVSLTKSLIAASGSCIAQAQSLSAAGKVVLNGSSVVSEPWGPFGANINVGLLDTPRRIAIISTGNDSTITATINGFHTSGPSQTISEVVALTNAGTAYSVLDYMAPGTITLSGSTAANITIGTCGTGSTDWIMPNFHLAPFNIGIVEQLTGSVTWNLETTLDNYWSPSTSPTGTSPQPNVAEVIMGSTIAQPATLTSAVTGFRFTITAGTGTLAAQAGQAGIANY